MSQRFQPGDRVWLTLDDGVCVQGWYVYAKMNGRIFFHRRGVRRALTVIKLRVERRCETAGCSYRSNVDCMAEAALAEGLIR